MFPKLKFLLILFQIFFISFSVHAKTFKSIQGFSFTIEGYELISPMSSDTAAEFIKKNPSFNSDKFIEFYENFKKSGSQINLEFLLKSGNDLSVNNIMITAVDKVDKILRDKTIDEIDIKNVCEITTRQTNKRYGIQQTIYACMWIPFPEVAKFSFLREVSGINFGRTIQIQFVKNNRQYVITGTSADTKQSIIRMRKDLTSLVESIKFTNDD